MGQVFNIRHLNILGQVFNIRHVNILGQVFNIRHVNILGQVFKKLDPWTRLYERTHMVLLDHMAEKLYVIRLVTPEMDGDWIPQTFLPGDIVWEYTGATYGCINWNNGIAVSLFPSETPFFEMPLDALAKPLKV